MSASTPETRARKLPSTAWQPGRSGNPRGRPRSPVDIAALARVHGPRCIAVAVELLDDPDSRVRLGALTALLDRGFGRPAQVIATPDGNSPIAMHLLAATMISEQLTATLEQRERYAINGPAEPSNGRAAIDLSAPPPTE
jgi:HEAT repeat protein